MESLKKLVQTYTSWELSDATLKNFDSLETLLLRANEIHNLTAVRNSHDIQRKHFLDSCTLLPHIPPDTTTLVDVGSGAGFPALPIAIVHNHIHVTCVESVQKKAHFIQTTAETLHLTNISVLPIRAEEVGHHTHYRETFDVATARAVAQFSTVLEYTLPLVKVGGLFIAQKTTAEDLSAGETALRLLGGEIQALVPIQIPELSPRHLVLIKKIKQTPLVYPRKPGVPLKKPL